MPTDAPGGRRHAGLGRHHLVLVQRPVRRHTGIGWTYGPPAVRRRSSATSSPASSSAATRWTSAARSTRWCKRRAQRRPRRAPSATPSPRSTSRCGTSRPGCSACRCTGCSARSASEVPVYGSGGFTTYDDDAARPTSSTAGCTSSGIPRVKIKIGESWGTRAPTATWPGCARPATVIGDDAELFVDANGGYTRKQAVRVMGRGRRLRRPLVRGAGLLRRPGRAARGPRRGPRRRRPPASTATTSPTSGACARPARWTACRSTRPAAAGITEWLRVGRRRRVARPGGLRALRAAPARARGRGDPEPAPPGVVPRPRPHRDPVLRRHARPDRRRAATRIRPLPGTA